jgi:hypothetical protein
MKRILEINLQLSGLEELRGNLKKCLVQAPVVEDDQI